MQTQKELRQTLGRVEKELRDPKNVSVVQDLSYGDNGAAVVELLAARIDELTAALPAKPEYRDCKVIRTMRLLLAVALSKSSPIPIDERFDRYLLPEPRALFKQSDDHCYGFIGGLSKAGPWLKAIPEERLVAVLESWKAGRFSRLEARWKRALPAGRKKLAAALAKPKRGA